MPRSASQAGGRISLDVYRILSARMSVEIGEPVDDSYTVYPVIAGNLAADLQVKYG